MYIIWFESQGGAKELNQQKRKQKDAQTDQKEILIIKLGVMVNEKLHNMTTNNMTILQIIFQVLGCTCLCPQTHLLIICPWPDQYFFCPLLCSVQIVDSWTYTPT